MSKIIGESIPNVELNIDTFMQSNIPIEDRAAITLQTNNGNLLVVGLIITEKIPHPETYTQEKSAMFQILSIDDIPPEIKTFLYLFTSGDYTIISERK